MITKPTISWQQLSEGTGSIMIDDRPVARYSYTERSNHPYFDQLRPRNHAGLLETHAPWDHRWHHGLWWSWKFINDTLYWEDHEDFGGNRIGLGRTRVTDHRVETESAGGGLVITESLDWNDHQGRTVLTEQRSMIISADEDADDRWWIDWDLSWQAVDQARFEVTSYPEHHWGGYAGLNYRAARSMRTGEEILADGGRRGVPEIHGEPVHWSAYAGNVDGAGTDDPDHPAYGGVALFCHPQNQPAEMPSYVFSAQQDFGFLATAPLMHQPMTLSAGDTLRWQFRSLIFGRRTTADQFDDLYRRYGA